MKPFHMPGTRARRRTVLDTPEGARSKSAPGDSVSAGGGCGMLGLFQRPKLEARFVPSHAHTDEFAREIAVAGRLTLENGGSDAELSDTELIVIAGFRRIPLDDPAEWKSLRLAK